MTANTNLSKAALKVLNGIVAAGPDGTFLTSKNANVQKLADAGLVEVGAANGDKVAVRATSAGAAHVATEAVKPPTPSVAFSFSIDEPDQVELPPAPSRGSSGRTSKYPFDRLQLPDGAEYGQSFFMPDSAADGDALKILRSAANAANNKWKVRDPSGATRLNRAGKTVPVRVPVRRFEVREVTEGGEHGARAFRMPLKD